jgi:hypothetical protein
LRSERYTVTVHRLVVTDLHLDAVVLGHHHPWSENTKRKYTNGEMIVITDLHLVESRLRDAVWWKPIDGHRHLVGLWCGNLRRR